MVLAKLAATRARRDENEDNPKRNDGSHDAALGNRYAARMKRSNA